MNQLETHIARLKARDYKWPIPWETVELLAREENCKFRSYLCFAKVWTIGWGETDGIGPNMVWIADQCDKQFFDQVCVYSARVLEMCKVPTSLNELGALTSLAYNIGLGSPSSKRGLCNSTVLKLHNAGKTLEASRAFGLFNKARENGVLVEVDALVRRRASESATYLKKTYNVSDEEQFETPMPQAVEPEKDVVKGPIVVSNVSMGITGVLAFLSQFTEHTKPMIEYAKSININPLMVVGGILVVGAATSIFYRIKQRLGGWV